MNKPIAKLISSLAGGVAPAVIAASIMFAPVALGGHGDLDPDFADVGRLGPILDLEGPAWSLAALDNDDILLAGGDFEYICDAPDCFAHPVIGYDATNFVSRFSDTGSIDLSVNAARLEHTQVFDVIRQPDGKLVAVGRRVSTTSRTSQLIVFRLQPNGPLDTTFGNAGIVELSIADHGQLHMGTSVDLDPNGRIVVAGSRANELIVLRLHANGSFDDSFGASGVFIGPENNFVGPFGLLHEEGPRVLRVADGGYRVTIKNATGCQVVALTAGGALDNLFGSAGIADVNAPWGPADYCDSILAQPDGHLFVAGRAGAQGFATRLLTSGARDPSFSTNAVADILWEATALAAGGDDGSILVAGVGANGASIIGLQANGELDEFFGNAGSTLIDLPSEGGTKPFVHNMAVLPDGGILAAGGDDWRPSGGGFVVIGSTRHPFVIRLLGRDGGNAPGVLGVSEQDWVQTSERDPAVVVNVRRTGGDSGTVSVAYQAVGGGFGTSPATGGQDFVEVSGRLTWDDGDMSDQEIRVTMLASDAPEESEYLQVRLSDALGGAGLGTRNGNINIGPHGGEPFGQFAIRPPSTQTVTESQSVQVLVARNYYYTGAVSVTLTPVGGTATAGDDFAAEPVTLSWIDGESNYKVVEIPIRNDTAQEANETFTVELSNPTGGAVVGPRSSTTFTISANDQPPPPPPDSGGGGGAFGYLSLLLLGVIRFLRSECMAFRSRSVPPSC